MKKIDKKIYYRIEFVLAFPLMLGSRQSERTDKDLLVDACGRPVIPGSALAGIYRSGLALEKEEQKRYFGYVPDYEERKGDKAKEKEDMPDAKAVENISSRIIVYDAQLKTGKPYIITRRDFVALDEYKTAKQGSKFDAEVLEPGAAFVTYIEQNYYGDDRHVAEEIVKLWHGNQIVIGAKTMRGFGEVKDVKVRCAQFSLSDEKSVKAWLEFDLFSETGWTKYDFSDIKSDGKYVSVKLELELQGAISIRRYTTSVSEDGRKAPDQEQLTVAGFGETEPYAVIPGSTWAGAFRSHMEKLSKAMPDQGQPSPGLDMDYFGYVRGDDKKRSRIRFSESRISGGVDKELSRNAIDRFAGGTVDKALFTEKVHYGGTTELVIGFDDAIKEDMLLSLAAALTDLHYGFLPVGGETAIGHGLFRILKVDGNSVEELLKKENGGGEAVASWDESNGQKLYEMLAKRLKDKLSKSKSSREKSLQEKARAEG